MIKTFFGLIAGGVIAAILILFVAPVVHNIGSTAASGENRYDIIFEYKYFSAKFFADGALSAGGTITGIGIAYPNNYKSVLCLRDEGACYQTDVEQIGEKQIGSIDTLRVPIQKWDANGLIAGEGDLPLSYTKTTMSIDVKSETVIWVEEPINQTSTACLHSETKIVKRTLEPHPFWKNLKKSG